MMMPTSEPPAIKAIPNSREIERLVICFLGDSGLGNGQDFWRSLSLCTVCYT